MDYKKIIKSREVRLKILNILRFIPDEVMVRLQYRLKTGRKLNLKNPQRFTERLQWYKQKYRNPIMHICVDKYAVRDYVKSKGLETILVPLLGKYSAFEEIHWETLPQSFVLKTTNGGGGLNVYICSDKSKACFSDAERMFGGVHHPVPTKSGGREWAYYLLPYGLVVEQLLVNDMNPKAGIDDYKFFCFSGNPKYIVVDVDRFIGHKRNFYDTNWKNLHVASDCAAIDREIPKPNNLEEMLRIAHTLSEDFPFVRVDLYCAERKVYFGELTFYPWSGYVQFDPDEFDYEMGKCFAMPCMR